MRNRDRSNHNADLAPVERLARPFRDFARIEASAGFLPLVGTVAAPVRANSTMGSL